MAQQLIGVGSAPNDTTGDPLRTSFIKCNDNFTELYNARVSPQGRLTLASATPVMAGSQTAKSTIYYTPHVGDKIPIYDGSKFDMVTFAELSCATTDTTKNPAAIGVSKVNDWFVWSDAGTLRLSHGPDWTNDTTRSAGTALTMVNGILLNSVAITNGPGSSRGTYVGTTRSNASSLFDWQFGGLATNGTAGFFGIWNAYNRVLVASQSRDLADSWVLTAVATWRSANGSTTMRCSMVRGLDEDAVFAQHNGIFVAASSNYGAVGVGLDTTAGFSGATGASNSTAYTGCTGTYSGLPGIGLHYLQAVEFSLTSAGVTFIGDSGNTFTQNGLSALFMA